MSQVYEKHKDKEDGLLYVIYAGENTFGSLVYENTFDPWKIPNWQK